MEGSIIYQPSLNKFVRGWQGSSGPFATSAAEPCGFFPRGAVLLFQKKYLAAVTVEAVEHKSDDAEIKGFTGSLFEVYVVVSKWD